MAGYTKGPWVELVTESSVDYECRDGRNIGGWQDIGPEDGDAVAVVFFRNTFDSDGTGDANARLIAAAPELLEALLEAKGLADMAEMYDGPGEPSEDQMILLALRDKINAAIAKATGADQ